MRPADLVVSDHYEGDRALDVHDGVVYLFRDSVLRNFGPRLA
jgi:hypothetical protein